MSSILERGPGKAPERKAGVTEEDGKSAVSLDGVHTVPIGQELAENIALALRVQDKLDEALMAGHRPGFLRLVSMLNCRKAISAVRGTVPLKELLSRKKLKQEGLSPEEIEELSGVPELKKDLEDILGSGRTPVLGSGEDLHIASHLDDEPGDMPAVVHVFDVLPKYEQEIVSKLLGSAPISVEDCMEKMHRNHTFLVLGKDETGKYICFQKQGPEIHHRFELQELDQLLEKAVVGPDEHIYLSFIGPIGAAPAAAAEAPEEVREAA